MNFCELYNVVYLKRKNRKSISVFAWTTGIALTAYCISILVIGYTNLKQLIKTVFLNLWLTLHQQQMEKFWLRVRNSGKALKILVTS